MYRRCTVSRLWFITSGGASARMSSARARRPRKSGTSTSICVSGECTRTARMQSTKCCAPPSRRSSRSTLVMTTYRSFSARDRPGEVRRFLGVERQRPAVADVAERAAARADVAHDHERRRALAEAFADVRARGFLAHRVQVVLAQNLLDFVEARRRRRTHADPVGLAQRFGRDDLDGDARGLGAALVLDAGGIVRRWDDGVVHGEFLLARCRATMGASSAPARSTLRATPRSASSVTARPG